MSTSRFLLSLATSLALATFASTSPVQGPTVVERAFPSSTALAEGVSPSSLDKIRELVQSFVDDEEIVGAELLVIKNGRSILHEGFGSKDREEGIAMGTGNVFCVRSMTKPLIGTSILMLAGDKQLELGDHVSKYLPSFSGEGSKDITIEHLLTHSSGLPLSLILAADLTALEGIQAVAQLGATYELDFEPGTEFNYSDQGTDTLTAVIEVVSGMPAKDFVRTRVLEPLGMRSTTCVMSEDHPLRERACCKYNGSRGHWNRFWSPDKPPLFPFFLGSQGLYSTLEDYGRFMELWLSKGRSRDERLLRARYVRKALTPSPFPFPGGSGLSGLIPDYGFLMQLWTGEGEVVAFGHGGSDGTWAWAFPEQKAIVLYFTQSRGNTTGYRFEEALGELLLGVPFDPNQAAPPFEQYLGYYSEDERSRYQAIIRDGEDLALETPGRRIRQLTYAGEDRWKFRAKPSVVLVFERSEDGDVTGFHIGDHQEFRFQPSRELPNLNDIAARVAKTHRIDLLESVGPIRMRGTLRIEKFDITGEVSSLMAWPDQFRVDSVARGQFEHLAFDGEKVWYRSPTKPVAELESSRTDVVRQENTLAVFGDWNVWYPKLEVIQRVHDGERDILILRTGDTSAPATTFYIDWKIGRLLRMDSVSVIEGMGRIGQQTTFSDFRDVSGVLLPFQSSVQLANPMIGTIVTTVDEFELGVELPEGTFQLKDLE
jgi:CubicO group peptidase (beta-lactamase class C family)